MNSEHSSHPGYEPSKNSPIATPEFQNRHRRNRLVEHKFDHCFEIRLCFWVGTSHSRRGGARRKGFSL